MRNRKSRQRAVLENVPIGIRPSCQRTEYGNRKRLQRPEIVAIAHYGQTLVSLTGAYCCRATWPSVAHARSHAPCNTSHCACLPPVVNYIKCTLWYYYHSLYTVCPRFLLPPAAHSFVHLTTEAQQPVQTLHGTPKMYRPQKEYMRKIFSRLLLKHFSSSSINVFNERYTDVVTF